MADSVEIRFVDEREFQNEGKWYFWIDDSQWEICSTMSDFSVEVVSEKGSGSDYSHDDSKSTTDIFSSLLSLSFQ
mgnify:CR=1 FL=1